MRPAHAPYADGKPAFGIGLSPLDLADWIEPDAELGRYLDEKRTLLAGQPDEVWYAEDDTLGSQREVLDALIAHLLVHHGDIYRRDGNVIRIAGVEGDAGRVTLADDDPAALKTASLLVQEDLVVMRKGDDGWRLVAGSVCFPSSWSFRDKAGMTLDGLHDPVPGYADKLRVRMARIFDNLHVERPVYRLNWSPYGDGALHHAHAHDAIDFAIADVDDDTEWLEAVHMRVERQTLRKMPVSGDIVFTIRIHVDRLSALAHHRDAPRLAAGLRDALLALDDDQTDYKGIVHERARLVGVLERLAAGGTAGKPLEHASGMRISS